MATIRVLTEDDLPAVTELFGRVYSERHWISPAACESYFREMLFDNPWRDRIAALQLSLDTAAPSRPLLALSFGRTCRVSSSPEVRGAPTLRFGRRAVSPVAAEPVLPGNIRARRRRSRLRHDAGPSARCPARLRAAACIRRAHARLVARSNRSQEAPRRTARPCRTGRRAAADRLVSLLRAARA